MNTSPLSDIRQPLSSTFISLHINRQKIDISKKLGAETTIYLNKKEPTVLRFDVHSRAPNSRLTCEGVVTKRKITNLQETSELKLDFFHDSPPAVFPRFVLFQSRMLASIHSGNSAYRHHTLFSNLTSLEELLEPGSFMMHFTCDSETTSLSLKFPFSLQPLLDDSVLLEEFSMPPHLVVSNFTESDGSTTNFPERRIILSNKKSDLDIEEDITRTIRAPLPNNPSTHPLKHTLAKGEESLVKSFSVLGKTIYFTAGKFGNPGHLPPPQIAWDPEVNDADFFFDVSSDFNAPYVFHMRALLLPADNSRSQTVELINQKHIHISTLDYIYRKKKKRHGRFSFQVIFKKEEFRFLKSWRELEGRKIELQFSLSVHGFVTPFRVYIIPVFNTPLPPPTIDPHFFDAFYSIRVMGKKLGAHRTPKTCEHPPIIDVAFDGYSTLDFKVSKKNPDQKLNLKIYAQDSLTLLHYNEHVTPSLSSSFTLSSILPLVEMQKFSKDDFQTPVVLPLIFKVVTDSDEEHVGCIGVRFFASLFLSVSAKDALHQDQVMENAAPQLLDDSKVSEMYEKVTMSIFSEISKQVATLVKESDLFGHLPTDTYMMSLSVELHHQFNTELKRFIDEWNKLLNPDSSSVSEEDELYFQQKAKKWLLLEHSAPIEDEATETEDENLAMLHLFQMCELAQKNMLFFSDYIKGMQLERYSYLFPLKEHSVKLLTLEKLFLNAMQLCNLKGRLFEIENSKINENVAFYFLPSPKH